MAEEEHDANTCSATRGSVIGVPSLLRSLSLTSRTEATKGPPLLERRSLSDGQLLAGVIPPLPPVATREPEEPRAPSGHPPVHMQLSGNLRWNSVQSSGTVGSAESEIFQDERSAWDRICAAKTFLLPNSSLFGRHAVDQTAKIWGSEFDCRESRRLSRIVSRHTYHDEMRTQLRDDSVDFSYLDAFDTDSDLGPRLVRVFSKLATRLEYLKVAIAVWTFWLSLTVFAFWDMPGVPSCEHADLMIDAAYALCLAVQLRTTILIPQQGREYCDPCVIASMNLSDSWFWVDIVSCLPLLAIRWIAEGTAAHKYIILLKASRGWRITRKPPKHHFAPVVLFLLIRMICAMLMGGHFMACMLFVVARTACDMGSDICSTMRHFMPEGQYEAEFFEYYSVALDRGFHLLLGSDVQAHSEEEHIIIALCTPLGAVSCAFLFGEIVLLTQRVSALETKTAGYTTEIQEAMRVLALAPDLQMRIMAFFTYERFHRNRRLFEALFADLSPQLRFELQLQLYVELVGRSGLFRSVRPGVIRELVVQLHDVVFLPGDWICRCGDYGDSMFFIMSGRCAVIHEDTVSLLKELTRGCYFGEVSLLTGVPRTAYVRSNTFSIMAQLTKEGFLPIVQRWPEEVWKLVPKEKEDTEREEIISKAARNFKVDLRRGSTLSRASRRGNAECDGADNNRGRSSLQRSSVQSSPSANLPAAVPALPSPQAEGALVTDSQPRSFSSITSFGPGQSPDHFESVAFGSRQRPLNDFYGEPDFQTRTPCRASLASLREDHAVLNAWTEDTWLSPRHSNASSVLPAIRKLAEGHPIGAPPIHGMNKGRLSRQVGERPGGQELETLRSQISQVAEKVKHVRLELQQQRLHLATGLEETKRWAGKTLGNVLREHAQEMNSRRFSDRRSCMTSNSRSRRVSIESDASDVHTLSSPFT